MIKNQDHKIKFKITTLGCKVNQYESDGIADYLKKSGFVEQTGKNKADFCIINTCTVTQKASMQSRQAIRQAIRSNPDAFIVVTGCYAQTEPDVIKKIPGVHYNMGHDDKYKIPETIIATSGQPSFCHRPNNESRPDKNDFHCFPFTVKGNKTRPFLKIQDGCNNFCTYCIVPHARGRSRSMTPEMVLKNIRQLHRAGYHEVVLTGIHLGAYGLDLSPKTNLIALLYRIVESKTIHRVRLSSIEPPELTDDIIKLVSETETICNHFHVPLQSGDDMILKKMHRPYTGSFFQDQVTKIHNIIPDAAIGVDTLIGFPGESDKAFENTYSLIKRLPVTYLHVFPFSSRSPTPASRYSQKVDSKIIKARCEKMRRLGNEKKINFYKNFIGKKVEIIIEGKRDHSTGLLKGITSNYIPLYVKGNDNIINTIARAKIEKSGPGNRLLGSITMRPLQNVPF